VPIADIGKEMGKQSTGFELHDNPNNSVGDGGKLQKLQIMKVIIKKWDAVTQWRWKLGKEEEDDEDVCGICRVAYDACCPDCKLPGDDCPIRESL
jgi:Anaphase-promoting complex subunit 11 RING-H2 finger